MYVSGLILGTIPFLGTPLVSYKFYLASIPFCFYSIFSIIFTGLFAAGWLPFIGKQMRAARVRSRTTGKLDSDTAEPLLNTHAKEGSPVPSYFKPSAYEFFIPLALLLSVTITPFILWRYDIITDAGANRVNEAFMLATIAAIVVAKVRGMHFHDIMDGFLDGCKDMTIGAIIFALALALAVVTKELHTADYLVHVLSNNITPIVLPGALMILCMITAFSTGTSFGTYAVVYPIALPLAYAINPDPTFIKICFGAVLGGAVFGDQTSPISDTTIFSSMFTGCDLMDHVRTQLPLALFAAICGLVLSTLAVWWFGFC
jgi:Na+/H+ antiporter NhaC